MFTLFQWPVLLMMLKHHALWLTLQRVLYLLYCCDTSGMIRIIMAGIQCMFLPESTHFLCPVQLEEHTLTTP